jgi:nitrous oxide reductase accessory protein NosL
MLLLLTGSGAAADGIEAPKGCQQCGMDRITFSYSRMVIDYADGTSSGVCSLNCAVEEMKKYPKKKVTSLMVADYATRELVDARTATWVVGGKKPGVMTTMPKWAFARKEDAHKFIKENDGRLTNFDEALNLALKENE